MEADSALPPEPADPAGAGSPHPDPGFGESAEFPRQKRRYRREDEPPAEAPALSDPDIAAITTLLASLIAKKQAPPPAEEAKAAKIYRFVPKSGQPQPVKPAIYDLREIAGAPGNEESDGSGIADAGAPAAAAPRPAITPVQWKGELEERKRPLLAVFLYSLLVLIVAGAAFWAGNAFPILALTKAGDKQATSGTDASPEPAWSDGELSQLDRALTADQAGDLEKALAVAMTLRSNSGPLPGLDLYLSSIETRQLQFIEAEKKLRAMAGGPNGSAWLDAEIDTQRGFNLVRERRFDRAAKSFERAAMENPFEPVYFRNWGEALRRFGRLQEAITRFQEEILRYPVSEPELVNERQAAEFKIRLCQIEAGQDQPVKAALEEHLAGATPGGFWYLTGAAYALSHGDMAGAAADLGKAKEAMPADQFDGILGDYFFRTYATRAELATFFTEESQERQQRLQASMLYFIDP
jgi:tetratricopeptide (TPR) repeat protein